MFDTLRGFYHFATDAVPRGLEQVPPQKRQANLWCQDGVPLVSKVTVSSQEAGLAAAVARSLELLGGLGRMVKPGQTVLVKPNFNSPDPFPGSTDLHFLEALVKLLQQAGAKVAVGDSAGGLWRPTRSVVAKLGLPALMARLGVEFIAFDDRPGDWVRVSTGGHYLPEVVIPRAVYEADWLVYLPCLKTHSRARFSMSLKLGMGVIHPGQRRGMHLHHLEEKAAEINLTRQPDLIVMDGRKSFVTGGPSKGQLVEPGVILASGDMVAIDVEALKILLSYKAQNRLMPDPWQSPQIANALKHGLGSRDYRLVV